MSDCALIPVTLGEPDAHDAPAARAFLREFLSDPRVLSAPWPIRKILAHKIAAARAQNFADMLESISADGRSRLSCYEESVARKLSRRIGARVMFAHRYGKGNIAQTLGKARAWGIKKYIFIPLFAQCSSSVTLSIKREISLAERKAERLKIVDSYCDEPLYIKALADSALQKPREDWALLCCFHSVPLSHLPEAPYETHCQKTFAGLKRALRYRFAEGKIFLAWQSKMGRGNWLEPSAEDTALKLAQAGVKKLAVISPGFAFDCTETLCELGRDLRKTFLAAGGENFELISCLNDSEAQISILETLFKRANK